MSDRTLHRILLFLISLDLFGRLVVLTFGFQPNKGYVVLDFISTTAYFGYLGWLGFSRKAGIRYAGRYALLATAIVVVDSLLYFATKGWA